MVAYSFKVQFEAPILAGAKRQTIRSPRKRHARAGEEVQLYYAMRTRHCRLIGRAICRGVSEVRVMVEGRRVESIDTGTAWTTAEETDAFARLDGFADWNALRDFWRAEHPTTPVFSGVMIRWGDLL